MPRINRRVIVTLPARPTTQGTLPLGGTIPAPTAAAQQTTQVAPGNQRFGPRGAIQQSGIQNPGGYQPTPDFRVLPGQVGPFGVLVASARAAPALLLDPPPDVVAFIAATPDLQAALSLCDSLLARVPGYSMSGMLTAASIVDTVGCVVGSYLRTYLPIPPGAPQNGVSADLMLYLARIKALLRTTAVTLRARAPQASGSDTPFVEQEVLTIIGQTLALRGGTTPQTLPTLAQAVPLLADINRRTRVAA